MPPRRGGLLQNGSLPPRRGGLLQGFTLVELLVSVGLTAILLWGLLQLFTSATKFSGAVATESELAAAGRAFLTRLTRDVAGIAPFTTGYMRIIDAGDGLNSIQFVGAASGISAQLPANASDDGSQLVHVKYGPMSGGGYPCQIGRGVKLPTDNASALNLITYTFINDPASSDFAALKPLGVSVEQFQINYLDSSGAVLPAAGFSAGNQDFTSGKAMPRAILFKVRLRDPRSNSSITLQSAAYLAAAGL